MSCVICHTISYLQPRDDPLEQIGASLSLGSKDPQRPISCAIIFEKCKKNDQGTPTTQTYQHHRWMDGLAVAMLRSVSSIVW